MRSTSIKSYHETDIAKMCREVLNYVRLNAPVTGPQVEKVNKEWRKRLSDLRDMGLIKNDGTTINPDTGRVVAKWIPTDQINFTIDLSQPKRKPYREIEAENRRLTEMLTEALYRSSAAYDAGYRQKCREMGEEMGEMA